MTLYNKFHELSQKYLNSFCLISISELMKKLVLVGIIVMMLMISGIVIATNGKTIEKKTVITSFEDKLVPEVIEELNPDNKAKFVQDEIIVKFKGDVKPFRVIKVPEGKVGEKIKEHLERRDVIYAEPNYIAYALMIPNDPYYKYQWHLDNPVYGGIQMEKAWDISTGANSVVAIVDTGIAYENYGKYCQAPDLAQTCFVSGYDFVNNDNHPNDDNRHGTHVAGTVAQSTNNNLGVAGVAFNTCLMPVKVLDSRGSGTYANVADGIRYAADNGAKVISLSLGGSSDSQTLKDAVAYAYNKGVTVIAACGNDNKPICLYPAAYDEYVIAVGATQYDEKKAPYSNYGPSLDLVAPGGNNNLDQNRDGYADGVLQQTFKDSLSICNFAYYFFQGTSMATPHVSGVAALLIANGNANTPDQIREALQSTAEDKGTSGRDDIYGWGLVDAYAAVNYVPTTTTTTVPTTTTTTILTTTTTTIPTTTTTTTTTTSTTTTTVPTTKCWSAQYQYLYRAADQARKFCKCAQGTYGYQSYKYSWGTKTVWKYVDPANNENWQVASTSSYTPLYSVTCTDGKAYPTNIDYYYPK
jgi:serine protease